VAFHTLPLFHLRAFARKNYATVEIHPMGGLLCYSLLESCYLVVPFDVSFIPPATILLLSLSLSLALVLLLIQFQGRLPTRLDWTGLACRNGHFANDQWAFSE